MLPCFTKMIGKRVYEEVEECYEGRRREEMGGMKSMGRYGRTKNWERVDEDHAEFTGEVGRWGALCARDIWMI